MARMNESAPVKPRPSASNDQLPKGWRMVRFGDVVRDVNEAERNPLDAGLERYVGLEHIEPENLHLKAWGDLTTDEVSFTKRFRKGHVLFGKRRAYQRKVAVAEFDGICSSDILTFEPKDDDLLPELLPFIVQSEGFFEHALGTSSGSLSPRTRWSQLQDYQFPLPPKDEQRRIAEILWAADVTLECYRAVSLDLELLMTAWTTEFLTREWEIAALGDLLADIKYGSSTRASDKPNGGVPILGIPNVICGQINLSDFRSVELPIDQQAKYRLETGDILIVRTNGNPDYVGRTAVVENLPRDSVYASYLIRLRAIQSRILPIFLHCALSSRLLRATLRHEIRSSAGNYNLNTKGIQKQRIPLPPIEEQMRFSETFAAFRSRIELAQKQSDITHAVKQNLTNALLRGDA